MALRSRINQYQHGINAHFQSYAQHERDGWVAFHNTHVTHLCELIDQVLPPGYEVVPERSLQIRLYDPLTAKATTHRPEPDITIWDGDPSAVRAPSRPDRLAAAPVATKPLTDTMVATEETRLKAIVIREIVPIGQAIPVTRIELLSPANEVGEDRGRYLAKRDATLEVGTILVEVDYVHEIDSPVPGIPGYASRAPGAYPYTIIVSDPRPSIQQGQAHIYGFRVDEAMPPIDIPLAGHESILLDFAAAYNRTFSSLSTFSNRADYSKEPVALETYTKDDRFRIWARMLAVMDAERAGRDLQQGPFPAPIEDPALKRLASEPFEEASLLIDEDHLDAYWLIRRRAAGASDDHSLVVMHRHEDPQSRMIGIQVEHVKTAASSTIAALYSTLKSIFEQEGLTAFLRNSSQVSQR
jgi:hypothetical protein